MDKLNISLSDMSDEDKNIYCLPLSKSILKTKVMVVVSHKQVRNIIILQVVAMFV